MLRKILLVLLLIILFFSSLVGGYFYEKNIKKNFKTSDKDLETESAMRKLTEELYGNWGFDAALQEDSYRPGYFLTGFTDGEILNDSYTISGTSLKNMLSVRLYFMNKSSNYVSVMVPILTKDEEGKMVVLDTAAAAGFRQENITSEYEIINYFKENLEGKAGKVLSISLRQARETASDEDSLSDLWNDYFGQNKLAYEKLISEGDASVGVLFLRTITSTIVQDRYVEIPNGVLE